MARWPQLLNADVTVKGRITRNCVRETGGKQDKGKDGQDWERRKGSGAVLGYVVEGCLPSVRI